ncbi:MAG: alpha/beta hydrolase family protein [Gemmatimonadaceae bacterium]
MRSTLRAVSAALIIASPVGCSAQQSSAGRLLDENALREYAGIYQWSSDSFVYLQPWAELTGKNQLVAFDESGDVRTLFPTDRDRFFAGPAAADSSAVQSRIEFHRDSSGKISALIWRREGDTARVAQRLDIEKREDLNFVNGDVKLAGTLTIPRTGGKHPAIILVHASGAEDRDYLLPFAHFLVRRGFAILGYDKRGVGGSTGNWRTASFNDLAGDVVAAFEYLKSRPDIDAARIGLLGWSQAGWVMPIAAVRVPGMAFIISISGAAIPTEQTTIDQAHNELLARGMKPETVDDITNLMKLQYQFARTGQGWEDYAAARERIAARLGQPPEQFPAKRDDPHWDLIRRQYIYDPTPTLHQLRVPMLGLFGELDNNILAAKNAAAWDSALKTAGNTDYTLRILPKANHLMLEAKVGNNAEMPSLQRFVPSYYTTVREWLAMRIPTSQGAVE